MNVLAARPSAMWHPPGWSPPAARDFLAALAGDDERLAWWAGSRPDTSWAEWLHRQGLAPHAWRRLKDTACVSALPPALADSLRRAYYAAAGDAELHRIELSNALAVLSAAGVTPILFKGAALAHTVYPDPACRPMGDLDLWVTAEAMPAARAALSEVGYAEHGKESRPLALQAQLSGEVQLVGRAAGQGLVELHWGAFPGEWLRRTAAVDHADIFCRARSAQIAGHEAWVMAPEDAAIQLAIHQAVSHQMSFAGVRGLLDVALLCGPGSFDWSVLVQRARAWRVASATWLVLSLTVALFGLPGAALAVATLAPSSGREAALRRFVTEQSVLAGRDITGGPLRFAYQLALVDRPADAAHLVARTLWPEQGWLQARYGQAGPAIRFRHLSNAARGRI